MAADDRMTVDERRRYLKRMHGRYWARDRKGRSALLDEIVAYTGLHWKYVIKLLRAESLDRMPRRTRRKPTYGPDVEHAVLSCPGNPGHGQLRDSRAAASLRKRMWQGDPSRPRPRRPKWC